MATWLIRCPACGLTVHAPADKPLPVDGPKPLYGTPGNADGRRERGGRKRLMHDPRAEEAIARLIEAGDDLLGNLDTSMSDSLRVAARWRLVKHEATVSRTLLDLYVGKDRT